MDKYIRDLSYVIQNCEMDNTYKMVWIRSIVESCVLNPNVTSIHFDDLAPKIFGYYWNQTVFFDLEQGPNLNKRPGIHQLVLEQVNKYQSKHGKKPEYFSKIEHRINIPVKKISDFLSKDVCWRFKNIGKEIFDLYDLDIKKRTIQVPRASLIKEYSDILFDLINYRWTQKLEEFNSAPRISKKVKGVDKEKIRRKPLGKFKKYLDLENPQRLCFISGDPIDEQFLSIDHVIPWSYMFSDDLWNLVYVDKRINSSKGNRIPTKAMIDKLNKRNAALEFLVAKSDKHIEELKLANEHNWPMKYWISYKG